MWSRPHRLMVKFELAPLPGIRATRPCRMQRQQNEDSFGFMGPRIGPPRFRARSALAKEVARRLFREILRLEFMGQLVGLI